VHSGAGADVCVAVHGDRGSVCRCDESMAGRLDVALGVGEDDSLIFGANLGVIGTDNVAFPAVTRARWQAWRKHRPAAAMDPPLIPAHD
jgi:hypothetical protein